MDGPHQFLDSYQPSIILLYPPFLFLLRNHKRRQLQARLQYRIMNPACQALAFPSMILLSQISCGASLVPVNQMHTLQQRGQW